MSTNPTSDIERNLIVIYYINKNKNKKVHTLILNKTSLAPALFYFINALFTATCTDNSFL